VTLDQIVGQVASRLNLTSGEALARIAEDVREKYRDVLGTVGLATSTRGTVTGATVIGNQYVTFYDLQKIMAVFDSNSQVLAERTFDEIRNAIPGSGSPSIYAIANSDSSSCTVFLNNIPTAVETLTADALVDASITLTGSAQPKFPSIYHDILVHGAMAIELMKMEKPSLAEAEEGKYQQRVSDLRYFLAKSAYLDIYQNRTGWPWNLGWPLGL